MLDNIGVYLKMSFDNISGTCYKDVFMLSIFFNNQDINDLISIFYCFSLKEQTQMSF